MNKVSAPITIRQSQGEGTILGFFRVYSQPPLSKHPKSEYPQWTLGLIVHCLLIIVIVSQSVYPRYLHKLPKIQGVWINEGAQYKYPKFIWWETKFSANKDNKVMGKWQSFLERLRMASVSWEGCYGAKAAKWQHLSISLCGACACRVQPLQRREEQCSCCSFRSSGAQSTEDVISIPGRGLGAKLRRRELAITIHYYQQATTSAPSSCMYY